MNYFTIDQNGKLQVLKFLSAAVIITVMCIFSACGGSKKLEGKWTAAGNLGDSTDMHSWFIEYTFTGNNYRLTGYPPKSEEGTFEVIEEKGDSLYVYFNVVSSSPETKNHKDWLYCKDSILTSGGFTLRRSN